jgi:hypothetical protein
VRRSSRWFRSASYILSVPSARVSRRRPTAQALEQAVQARREHRIARVDGALGVADEVGEADLVLARRPAFDALLVSARDVGNKSGIESMRLPRLRPNPHADSPFK